ncbi:MAG TPA: DUF4832 domain-containing protein [Kofleriaceae bacterium]|jgi:hypothetical protein
MIRTGRFLFTALPALAVACDAGTITTATDDDGPDPGDGVAAPAGGEEGGPDGGATFSGPTVTIDFETTNLDFRNPERGFFRTIDLIAGGEARWVRRTGHTLAQAIVRLDDYRDRALDGAFLTALRAGLADVRRAGIKVVLRFAYNDSFDEDASRSRILGHINQLAPILADNADVIAVMQAGFIGAWGEWHSSTNGLDNDVDRGVILHALLDALPPSRAVQVRTPMFKDAILPGGPLDADEAWSEEDRARVGHHNDCFLADDSDYGTYDDPVATWKQYVAQDGRYLPIGGETCAVNSPQTDCDEAVASMESLHWSHINEEYNQDVLGAWDDQGCGDEVRRRLGPRLALVRATLSEAVAPGGALDVELEIENQGFSAFYNPRPIHLVLRRGDRRWDVALTGADARELLPGVTTLSAHLQIPADAEPADDYRLALWLPDAAPGLRGDRRYSVRLANRNVWDASEGDNVITSALSVDPAAAGAVVVDPSATELVELER